MDGWMDGWVGVWVNRWMDGQILQNVGQMKEQKDGQMNNLKHGWTIGGKDVSMDEQPRGWSFCHRTTAHVTVQYYTLHPQRHRGLGQMLISTVCLPLS